MRCDDDDDDDDANWSDHLLVMRAPLPNRQTLGAAQPPMSRPMTRRMSPRVYEAAVITAYSVLGSCVIHA